MLPNAPATWTSRPSAIARPSRRHPLRRIHIHRDVSSVGDLTPQSAWAPVGVIDRSRERRPPSNPACASPDVTGASRFSGV